METIITNDIPALTSRYMPKKQDYLARQILDAAFRRYQERQFPDAERKRVGEIVAAELERRNPPADMDVLERYGLTQLEGKPLTQTEYLRDRETGLHTGERREVLTGKLQPVTVSAYNPYTRHWVGVSVEIPRPVRVAARQNGLSANGRAARLPAPYTITPENVERHKREGTWEQVCADNEAYYDKLAAESLPPETDAYFQRVIDLRRVYRDEYQRFHDWLAECRQETGKYPTWAEIAERFGFIADYFAELAAERDREAA